ncbi:MAG: rRNA maturation RNase YbeY [bacterium]|nr:rRNA maturation RNase YbeY [bacterium]
MNKVSVTSVGKSYKKLEPQMASVLKKLISLTKKGDFFTSLYLVDNRTMRKLNRDYRKKDKVTNVLSFVPPKGFIMPSNVPKTLGEIYLAPDYIRIHNEDIVYLLIHGFLHLLGFEHERKNDTIRMQKMEKHLLHKIKKSKLKNQNLGVPAERFI